MAKADQIEPEAAPADPAAHLDEFRAAELEATAPADDVLQVDENGEAIVPTIDPEQITKEAFYVVFEKAFWFPGAFMPPLAPLAIQPGHEATLARDASDAIYEILEIYWPGALLPQSDMLARVLVIVPFAMLKYATVREILRAAQPKPERQKPAAFQTRRKEDQPQPAAAPDQDEDDHRVIHLSRGILDGLDEAA